MVKSKILTPVLAGVLGVTVVGSGVGYYFTRNDSSNEIKNGSKLSQVANNFNSTINNAEKALTGEIDFAYNADATVTFGEGFTSISGMELKPIQVVTNTKQKGGNTGADFNLKYDGKNLASFNTVIDRTNKNAYVQIPELSDGYLKANGDSIKDLLNSELSSKDGASIDFDKIFGDSQNNLDSEALEKDFDAYGDLIKQNLPEATDGDKLTGELDGNKYEYTTKVYTITGEDAKKVIKAVLEKAQTDETLKNAVTQQSSEVTGETYDQLISEYLSKADTMFSDDNLNKSVKFEAYYNEDVLAGFNFTEDDVSSKLITVETSDAYAVDFSFNAGSDTSATLKGSSKTEKDVTNGNFTFDMTASEISLNSTFKLENVKSTDDALSGKIRIDVSGTSGTSSEPFSCWCEFNSNSEKDKSDFTYDIGINGQSFVTVKFVGSKTEASDITVPSGDKIYDVTDDNAMDTYLKGCDTDGFMSNIKSAIGDELYNSLFASDTKLTDDDYDLSDFDLDTDDFALGNKEA